MSASTMMSSPFGATSVQKWVAAMKPFRHLPADDVGEVGLTVDDVLGVVTGLAVVDDWHAARGRPLARRVDQLLDRRVDVC